MQIAAMQRDARPLMVLDVRRTQDFEACHVPGALSIPFEELSAAVQAGELDAWREQPLAIMCSSGVTSAQACVRLSKVYGFAHPINVTGGLRAWRDAGLPTSL